jgi:probable rRNA maturation factor
VASHWPTVYYNPLIVPDTNRPTVNFSRSGWSEYADFKLMALIKLSFADRQKRLVIGPRWIRNLVQTVLHGERINQAQIHVVLLSDAGIHAVNRRFLRHDEPTDVITFPMSAPGARPLEGEIVISTETAARAAAALGHSPRAEVALYLVHGLLHLAGYDDRSPRARRVMRRRERYHLAKLRQRLKAHPPT